ncbi:MAG: CPBP family intramembrane metalloprotease [Myxococcota bacterium]|nr:CPBP family intramembrane metalloprotease [Myxococcota bacterium]
MEWRDLHPKRFFLETWRQLDAQVHGQSGERKWPDSVLACVVFASVAVSMICQEYLGDREAFLSLVSMVATPEARQSHPLLTWAFGLMIPGPEETFSREVLFGGYLELWVLCYWALWRILGFGLLPALLWAVYPALRQEGLGLSFKGFSQHAWVYAVLFVPVFIAVVAVSFLEEFTTYYPFYSQAHRSLWEFAVWDSFYLAQFLCLELFFRGFMLQPLRKVMGSSAIFAMMVPYVMIHFGKPMLECFGAVIAGIVLGTLAMRTRSIWAGFALHAGIALSMDLLSIWQNTLR